MKPTSTNKKNDKLDEAVKKFESLTISKKPTEQKCRKDAVGKQCSSKDKNATRFVPYRRRRSLSLDSERDSRSNRRHTIICSSDKENGSLLSTIAKLKDVKLNGDVESLKNKLVSKSSSSTGPAISSGCSIEARNDESFDGEVNELAEYFNQFVNVKLKMSALAESMYA